MKPEFKIKKEKTGLLNARLSGSLTLRHHDELKDIFQKLKTLNSTVTINIEAPDELDLCFLQMLWSFIKQCQLTGRIVTVLASVQEADEKLLSRLNLIPLLKHNPTHPS